ncbi:200_t:CDS:2 [Diversispora eburnea]|uniref:200_t:CDS:1 n=1 Tax=Diversispora eburnea TaxID=1213867 RepID=A0A9N8W5Q5_9GLOM|nr:200_t:CDS:2 [Diversispora eburnea]
MNSKSYPTKTRKQFCSHNSFKLLAERISRIENLVSDLARLTKEFNSNKIAMRQSKYLEGINLSSCKLEDLQKIITSTTNSMTSNFKRKFCEDPEDKILDTNIDPKKLRKSGKNSSNWLKPEKNFLRIQ